MSYHLRRHPLPLHLLSSCSRLFTFRASLPTIRTFSSHSLHSNNRRLQDSIQSIINDNILKYNHSQPTYILNEFQQKAIVIDGNSLSLEHLELLETGDYKIVIDSNTRTRLQESRNVVDDIVAGGEATYGVNTGFGLLSYHKIDKDRLSALQVNLIRSHCSGVGEPLPPALVRRIMALRINTLARGYSGVSLTTLDTLVAMFNAGLTPLVPSQGTVGASGDLAPLAHVGLAVMGEGKVFDPRKNKYVKTAEAFADYNIKKAELGAKDGLSLVNGTQFITGIGSKALDIAIKCIQVAQPIASLSLVALMGIPLAMDPRVSVSRPHPGQSTVAAIMRQLVPFQSNTSVIDDKKGPYYDVQDPYSLRCIPQVHGPVLEELAVLLTKLETEMNASTDNPLVFSDTSISPHVISAGNFHGEHPAKILDTLALYIGEIGRIATARILLLVDPKRSRGLPAFVAPGTPGINSGFMCWELTACAIDAENRTLSMPASAETATTGAGKEDHVSMGGFSARKALQVAQNVQKILAIELMITRHAIEARKKAITNFKLPDSLVQMLHKVASLSPEMLEDRVLTDDFEAILDYIDKELPRLSLVTGASCDSHPHDGQDKVNLVDNKVSKPVNDPNKTYLNALNISKYLSKRALQTNFGELDSFTLPNDINSLQQLQAAIAKRASHGKAYFVLDSAEEDFGSRANFGRGHAIDSQETSSAYDYFMRRLSNIAVNKLNESFGRDICVLGSFDCSDLQKYCENSKPSVPSDRERLIDAVKLQHTRLSKVVQSVIHSNNPLYLVNGDHNHMTGVLEGYYLASKQRPVVIYLDLHADTRPIEDGPHSGTWCSEAHINQWIEKAYVIGLNPLANNAATIENCDKYGVEYEPYTWDKLKSKRTTVEKATLDVLQRIKSTYGSEVPIILSICGDSVLGLPASAGTNTIGYSPEEVYDMVTLVCQHGNVKALTVAEFKTSLGGSHNNTSVGEFLTQCLYLYHKFTPRH